MTTPDRELLRELSSLKDLLEPPATAPQRKPAPPVPEPAPLAEPEPLLNLAAIFDDDDLDTLPFPRFTLAEIDGDEPRTEPGRERLIDTLVEQHLPRLEAALRRYLRNLDEAELRAWCAADD